MPTQPWHVGLARSHNFSFLPDAGFDHVCWLRELESRLLRRCLVVRRRLHLVHRRLPSVHSIGRGASMRN
eukprot:SAG31_NODE_18659_length_627_cov_1.369318_2_plen_69_part_01